ncbi:MAG: antitoxin family protein [Eubacteriales bacterium]
MYTPNNAKQTEAIKVSRMIEVIYNDNVLKPLEPIAELKNNETLNQS